LDVFEESLENIETMDLEAMEAVVEQREVCNEEMSVDIIGALGDRYGDRALANKEEPTETYPG
jgi:hypothetical protein